MNSLVNPAISAVIIISVIFAAGCIAPGPLGVQPSPVTTQPLSSGTGAVNIHPSYSDAELKQMVTDFDAYAGKARQDWGVPGMAIAIVTGDDVLLAKGYGVKTAGGNDNVTPETVFQIASTSKAFTSTMVAMEVDRGTLKWDDKVTTYLPEFQMKDPWVTKEFTITDTMAHRSGLPANWGDELMTLGYNDSYAIHALRYAEPQSSFRSQYAYQNVVYSVPTVIIEKNTGKSWPDNLQERIFTPLGMTGSSADYESFRTAEDVASPHLYHVNRDGTMVSEPIPLNSPMRNMTYLQPGAGGINSNIHDMANWLRFQMGNGTFNGQRLVSEANLNYVHSPKTPFSSNMDDPAFYCQGWIWQETKYGPIIWHNGAVGGYYNYIGYSPKEKIGIVILSNNIQSRLPDALFYQFFSMYFGETGADVSGALLKAKITENAAAVPAQPAIPEGTHPALPLPAYTGTYTNTPYGTAIVSVQDGNLTVTMGPAQQKLLLVPGGGNAFLISGTPGLHPVLFDVDTDNKVKSMTLTFGSVTPVFIRA
jgi:CubicO group peptidase (beta-lactamase class C family)